MKTSRRDFLAKSILATAGVSAGLKSVSATPHTTMPAKKGSYTLNIFSKNLHWLNYAEMATAAAEMGFDGIDLTVRPEGHVLPERVADDLPRAVDAIRKAGLNVHMITTSIDSVDSPHAESILKTSSALGIGYYRMGWIQYETKATLEDNLRLIQQRLSLLGELNKKYDIQAHYQNHSGASFGAPIWDLWNVFKEINNPWIGSQYDVMHANVEGANSWVLGLKLLKPYIGTLDIKDFQWVKKEGKWKAEVVPLGEGMIDYKKYLALLKEYAIEGPFSIHYEYPLGGAENGNRVITMRKEEVLAAMKKDRAAFSKLLVEAGLK